jgi:hypothetical protein
MKVRKSYAAAAAVTITFLAVPLGADETAERGRVFLGKLTAVNESYLGERIIGVYAKGKYLGELKVSVQRAEGTQEPAYRVQRRGRLSLKGVLEMFVEDEGTLLADFSPLSAQGVERQVLGEFVKKQRYKLTRDGATCLVEETTEQGDGPPRTTSASTPSGAGLLPSGIAFLFPRVLLSLETDTLYAFRVIADGQVKTATVRREAALRRQVLGRERNVVPVVVVVRDATGKESPQSFQIDAETGEIAESRSAPVPVVMHEISRDEIGKDLEPPPEVNQEREARDRDGRTPTEVVVAFFGAVHRKDERGLLQAVDAKALIWNTMEAAPKGPEVTREKYEELWRAGPKEMTERFVKDVFEAAHREELVAKWRGAGEIIGLLASTKVEGSIATTRLALPGRGPLSFELERNDGLWKISKIAQK